MGTCGLLGRDFYLPHQRRERQKRDLRLLGTSGIEIWIVTGQRIYDSG